MSAEAIRTPFRVSGRTMRIIFGGCALLLACSFPGVAIQAEPPTPELIAWWTNTPDPGSEDPGAPPPAEITASLLPTETSTPLPSDVSIVDDTPYVYAAQSGDTLYGLSVRFSVLPEEITSPGAFSPDGLLSPGQLFVIPRRLANTTSNNLIFPDSEVIYSPSVASFKIEEFVQNAGGYLSTYRQYLGSTGWTSGAEIVARVGSENSINPRLLLTLLQYQAGWVYGQPGTARLETYPMGLIDQNRDGLYAQLNWAAEQLSVGYYGWREGYITEILLLDGSRARLAPELNAGSVAIHHYLSQLFNSTEWLAATDPAGGLPALHAGLFGDYWARAAEVEPLFPPGLSQPEMILPFAFNQIWSYSGGPHGAWGRLGARAAIDFAPGSVEPGCVPSDNLVLAAAPGLLVRSAPGVLVLDLDGDGREYTGWVLLYLHIATENKIPIGTWVTAGQFIGNPSCEGGFATGTHIHIARKYNGEWIPAGGPIPFVLDGWVVGAGNAAYEGTLTLGDVVIYASPLGTFETRIIRRYIVP